MLILINMSEARRAKIVCTLGPATFSPTMIEKLIRAGMDVARLNFSHGDHATYRRVIRILRQTAHKLGKPITIVQDLQGPKIRTGKLSGNKIVLKPRQRIVLTTKNIIGNEKMVSVPYRPLPRLLKKGNLILIDDGLIELRVLRSSAHSIECVVITGGDLRENKGVNLPYLKTVHSALTSKDRRDLAFGIRAKVDFVAISFVCRANDILALRKRIPKTSQMGVIAKIEKREAIDHFDDILAVSDAVMVARGDLAVECSSEVVPCLQKEIISKCNRALKPVITATQMLESMVKNPRPSRAEASDVANAVLDGSDALMLSSETAFGRHPVESVTMMDKIIREVEHHHYFVERKIFDEPHLELKSSRAEMSSREPQVRGISRGGSIERAACQIAQGVNAKLICCLTEKGRSAMLISRSRPKQPIIALTDQRSTMRKLSLVWGTRCYFIKRLVNNLHLFRRIRERLLELKLVRRGDSIVVTTGVFTHAPDTERITKVHRV